MRIRIIFLLVPILFFQNPVFAEAGTVKQKLVGGTIKAAVRIVVSVTNIEKVKKKLVNKLELMKDDKFKIRYAEFYKLLKDLPSDIKTAYKVTPYMTRKQMIKNIESVDKKKIYEIISSVPDKTVADLFKEYLRGMRQKS